ncbi:DUF6933 domain-containing protein [Algoriphagus namhaensis]
MKHTMSIYLSKKLKSYIGKQLEAEAKKELVSNSNEFFHWYGDVFFYQRKKFLMFTNELTRFVFAVGPFAVNAKKPLFQVFSEGLVEAMECHGMDPSSYLAHVDGFRVNTIPHRGATGHLNRTKDDYLYWLAAEGNPLDPKRVAYDFNMRIPKRIVSRNAGKEYIFPKDDFADQLRLL